MKTLAQKNRYRQRVLHRVRNHSSPKKEPLNVFDIDNLTTEQKKAIATYIPKSAFPILLYWRNVDTWTILGANFVYSFYDNGLTTIRLDEIEGIDLDGFQEDMHWKPASKLKEECEFLQIKNLNKKIWCFSGPDGGSIFTLWTVLLRHKVDKKYILSLDI